MPTVSPGETQRHATSLADMTFYSVTASDRQTPAAGGDGEGLGATRTDGNTPATTGEGGSQLDIPSEFLSSTDTDSIIGVSVSADIQP